ncbi:MAG TPA: Crp/Fnr family transcriptional regulator [Thermoanaerobaculia bacterium]|nr:Crp/Fnr family transcriptional regulator [Thermoanaerobaculia bacterium]
MESLGAQLVAALRASVPGGPARALRRGETLFRRGDAVRALFLLVGGRVRLERSLADGSWVAVHVARAPAVVAEASLFGDRYHCDAVAEVASRLVPLDRAEVERALARDAKLSRLTLRALAGEVRDLRSRMELRAVRPVERRVLLALELAPGGERSVASRAAELGMAPETLSRVLRRLEQGGRIVRDGKTIALAAGAPVRKA